VPSHARASMVTVGFGVYCATQSSVSVN
jgi:hypothetical protein